MGKEKESIGKENNVSEDKQDINEELSKRWNL